MIFTRIYPWDTHSLSLVKALLASEGLGLDEHLDYTAGLWEGERLLARLEPGPMPLPCAWRGSSPTAPSWPGSCGSCSFRGKATSCLSLAAHWGCMKMC